MIASFAQKFFLEQINNSKKVNNINMKKNMGSADRIIRMAIAILIVALYFTHIITGTLALILLTIMGIFVITSLVSFCPLYFPFGLSTKKKNQL